MGPVLLDGSLVNRIEKRRLNRERFFSVDELDDRLGTDADDGAPMPSASGLTDDDDDDDGDGVGELLLVPLKNASSSCA